jgi:hypothetical protein
MLKPPSPTLMSPTYDATSPSVQPEFAKSSTSDFHNLDPVIQLPTVANLPVTLDPNYGDLASTPRDSPPNNLTILKTSWPSVNGWCSIEPPLAPTSKDKANSSTFPTGETFAPSLRLILDPIYGLINISLYLVPFLRKPLQLRLTKMESLSPLTVPSKGPTPGQMVLS